jgi:thioredoxin 1
MQDIDVKKLNELQSEGKKILVDFWAPWCGPCRQLIPRLENIQKEYGNVEFVKINVDQNRDFAVNSGITSVPTVMIFDGSKLVNRLSGVQPDSIYKNILNSL